MLLSISVRERDIRSHLSTLQANDFITEGNRLCAFTSQIPMPSVRVLRFSDNDIAFFDISLFPKIRTLYADNNLLSHLGRSEHSPPSRLENLSLRNQRSASLHLTFIDLENIRRLYVSGNVLTEDFFPPRPLHSLVYLEAAACKMSQWPRDFASNAPHLKMLNLNYNYFTDLNGVKGMNNLRKLTLVGGRLGGEEAGKRDGRDVMAGLRGLQSLEELDLRCVIRFRISIKMAFSPITQDEPFHIELLLSLAASFAISLFSA